MADLDLLPTLPRTSHNVTCSSAEFGTYLYHACPHNMTHELLCDEASVGVWEVTCPAVTTNMTCKSIDPGVPGLSGDQTDCVVVSLSDTSMVCECPMTTPSAAWVGSSRRKNDNSSSSEDSRTVDVEFSAMLDFVVEDFVSTWHSVDDLSMTDVKQSKQVLLTIGFLIFCVVFGLFSSDDADKKDRSSHSQNGR